MPKHAAPYTRPDSPYWWVSYTDPTTLKRVRRATVHRTDDPHGKRRALDEAREHARDAVGVRENAKGWDWVTPWLNTRHRTKERTRETELYRWGEVRLFLTEHKLHYVQQVTFDVVDQYLAWRQAKLRRCGRPVTYNTTLAELRFFGRAMQEAVRRRYVDSNPLAKLGLKKDPPKEKPEMTDAEIALIREKLQAKGYEEMRVQFEIALHQGCRLRECSMPWSRVDFKAGTIQFLVKGGRLFTTQLHPGLAPILADRKNAGAPLTCAQTGKGDVRWTTFFQKHGLGHLCFHCTRVTVITRMARAGVPISQAMAYVGHASSTIHKIYQRLRPGDVGPAVKALTF